MQPETQREEIERQLRLLPCIVCLGDEQSQSKHLAKNKIGAKACICEGVLETGGTMLAAWHGAKVALIRSHIENARAESPDGKTQWDRVEDFRIEHGHLPGDKEAEVRCEKCRPQLKKNDADH